MTISGSCLKRWFLRSALFNSDLYRYYLSPLADAMRYWARYLRGPRPLPTRLVRDVRPLAAQRGWPLTVVRPATVQERMPSETISDELIDIIRNGRRRVRQSYTSRIHHTQRRGEMYYSHLYSHTRYPIDETFICEIPQALVLSPTGFVVTAQLDLLRQACFTRLGGSNTPIVRTRPDRERALPGRYVSLLAQPWVGNYSHWFIDSLVRLAMLDPADTDYKVLIPAGALSFHRQSLNLLGITDDRIVEMPQRNGHVVVERLLLCSAQQRGTQPHADYLRHIRDRLVQAVIGAPRHPAPWRRVYISRANASRRIINEPELLPLLQEYGFEVVYTEKLTMAEEIQLFAESVVVAGAHGAGMINPIFCNPGAIVIELFNRQRWHHCIHRTNSLVGHHHWHLFGDTVGGRWDTAIDPARLRKLFEYALDKKSEPAPSLYDNPY